MPLNIGRGGRGDVAAGSANRRRRILLDGVRDELGAWGPREFLGALRRAGAALSLVHLNVLAILDAEGPLSMSQLAAAVDVSVASMTGIVDRMEARGIVERRHDEADRRVVRVHVTAAGTSVFTTIDERRHEGLTLLLGELSDRQLLGLLVGHRALRRARAARLAHASGRESVSRDAVTREAVTPDAVTRGTGTRGTEPTDADRAAPSGRRGRVAQPGREPIALEEAAR